MGAFVQQSLDDVDVHLVAVSANCTVAVDIPMTVDEVILFGSVRKAGCNPSSRFQYYAHNLDSLNKKNGMSATPLNWLLKAFTLALNDSAPALVCLFTKKLSMVS